MAKHWHRIIIVPAAFLGCFCSAAVSLADDRGEALADNFQPNRHEHAAWSITVFPALYGALGVGEGGNSDGGSEFGGSVRLDKSLSNSMSLAAGLSIGTRREAPRRGESYMFELTPTFIAPLSQRDRFFIGLGVALLGIAESNEGTDWGIGPRISLGVDYTISNNICVVLEGNAGVAYLGGHRSRGDVISAYGNVAGWGRLMLGARLGL